MNRTQVGRELVRAGFRRERPQPFPLLGSSFRKPLGQKGWQLCTLLATDQAELKVTLQLDDGRARGTEFCIKDDSVVDVVLEYIEAEARRLLADDERLLKCPSCKQYMSLQKGPKGLFLGCDNWRPEGKRESWHCEGRVDTALVPPQRVWQ
jgi:hypothetical protein